MLDTAAETILTVKIPIVSPEAVKITRVRFDLTENKPMIIFLKKLFIPSNFSIKNINTPFRKLCYRLFMSNHNNCISILM